MTTSNQIASELDVAVQATTPSLAIIMATMNTLSQQADTLKMSAQTTNEATQQAVASIEEQLTITEQTDKAIYNLADLANAQRYQIEKFKTY